jgi:hypothetical protein
VASLSVETGIAPKEFEDMSPEMLKAIVQVLSDRAKEFRNASKRKRH